MGKIRSIGFTGPRQGMTIRQGKAFIALLPDGFLEFHHGDCVGSDDQAHKLVRQYFPTVSIHIHPPSNPKLRAFCEGDFIYPVAYYLTRNRVIVNTTDMLIATPDSRIERRRSGTWTTVRYARAHKRHTLIIFPDGSTKERFHGK